MFQPLQPRSASAPAVARVGPWFTRFATVALAVSAFVGCQGSSAPSEQHNPVIAASIFPLGSLVEQLSEPWAEVVTILPPGVSEHDAELHPDQLRELNRAELLVTVGMGLDDWAEKAAERAAPGSEGLAIRRSGER